MTGTLLENQPATPRPKRRLLRWVVALAVLAVLGWYGVGRFAESLPMSWQVTLGRETARPAKPTTYADGKYGFLRLQPFDPSEPVGYNPCKRILLTVNLEGAPPDGMQLVFTAMKHLHQASGLSFAYVGPTSERPSFDRGRVGPALVAWTDRSEMPIMDGGVLGIGGSGSYVGQRGETTYLVSGLVTLSSVQFAHLDRTHQQAVVDHEFGHLVGLAHVKDTGELMNPYMTDRSTFGHGDLTGLARLGQLPCR